MEYKLSLSILTANFLHLHDALTTFAPLFDEVHLDVCDGHFVPSLSFGSDICKQVIQATIPQPTDIHLMIANPSLHINNFMATKCTSLVFHLEADLHPLTTISLIQQQGIVAGIAVVPKTTAAAIEPLAGIIDRILVMGVNPGYGGQPFIHAMLKKIEKIRTIVGNSVDIIVDGGINDTTIKSAQNAGANIFVIGSAIFNATNKQEYINKLRSYLPHA